MLKESKALRMYSSGTFFLFVCVEEQIYFYVGVELGGGSKQDARDFVY